MKDYTSLFFFIFLGLPFVAQYFHLAGNKNIHNKAWAYSPSIFRKFSSLGITLAFISGLYMIYFTIDQLPEYKIFGYDYDTRGKYYVYLSLCLLLFSSNFWYLTMLYNLPSGYTILSLIGTATVAILLMANIFNAEKENNSNEKNVKLNIGKAAAFFLMFQTLIMDLMIWGKYYLK